MVKPIQPMKKSLSFSNLFKLIIKPAAAANHSTPYLALLVTIGEYLKAISVNRQELAVVLWQKRDHLLQTTGKTNGLLCTLLVKQQIVEGCDGVENHGLIWWAVCMYVCMTGLEVTIKIFIASNIFIAQSFSLLWDRLLSGASCRILNCSQENKQRFNLKYFK